MFQKLPVFLLLLLFTSCKMDEIQHSGPPPSISLDDEFFYEIDLNDRKGDSFKVRLFAKNLSEENSVFQFPATVPGIYSIADLGQFVKNFKAFDVGMKSIPTERISKNQFEVSRPQDVYLITYEVADIWDTTNRIYRMASTSLENDHALLNSFGVLGYPAGLKSRDFNLDIIEPHTWSIGTSLLQSAEDYFIAENYDKLVDSPLLLGELTDASLIVGNTKVGVYVYSESGHVSADLILSDIEQVLLDAQSFLEVLPVDRYNFLFHFDSSPGGGALEHSFSSVYTLPDQPYTDAYAQAIKGICAHEFFHIVTPLNIHSEIIEDFNFAVPTPSQHLWLYEGVTEWASDMMQFRNGSMTMSMLLNQFTQKLHVNDGYDKNMSLTEMSLTSYTSKGNRQFGNIYNRGAIIATLLDIKLIELSGGTYGLRDLILEFIEDYGSEIPFSENLFLTEIATRTYPEVEAFINSYIKGVEELPINSYFGKLGIDFNANSYTFSDNSDKTSGQQKLYDYWMSN